MDDSTRTGDQPESPNHTTDSSAGGNGSNDHRTTDTTTTEAYTGDNTRSQRNSDAPNSGGNPGGSSSGQRKRRRGSRGGQGRKRPNQNAEASNDGSGTTGADSSSGDDRNPDELPERISEGKVQDPSVAEQSLVRKPKVGDTRDAAPRPSVPPPGPAKSKQDEASGDDGRSGGQSSGGSGGSSGNKRRRRGGKGRGKGGQGGGQQQGGGADQQRSSGDSGQGDGGKKKSRRGGRGKKKMSDAERELVAQRGGRERNGKPVGRYFMCVQVRPGVSQVAVLEGRNLIEHYVSRPADDISQIHGNIYLGRVQNVLPGMEAAFVDIATPKNAVLYRGDVQYDPEDIEEKGKNARIEDILKARQMIMCQVTKNPIGAKGARLTQEVSLPGRFVVLIPNSKTYGISKRLPDDTRKRLRNILDRVKPEQHGLIVRTAAEHATEADLEADMQLLLAQWADIEAKAAKANKPTLLYREPELAVRVIREEFNPDYRGVVIDDKRLFDEVHAYVKAFNPELADRIEYYDADAEGLSLFERFHVHEQVHKALDRKVWLPSGGSLIIEHTEALTVIDVNTGKNVGKDNLEATVFHNNMEAAVEIAKQLRLRDIGGIIVIDFIDMEIKDNRAQVVNQFREALARDKTRTQVFEISELGLVEMTRKRIGEGLLTEFSETCPDCEGRGVVVDHSMLD
ncbi:MAG: Rne/Rng family ribonuclease [Ilumatobacter fluminis]|uniref:Rne/Rng family ribonuclease n=1 Tax=Ilumatobacter fluminis TaxID=467091 RepID=UPI0032EF65F0